MTQPWGCLREHASVQALAPYGRIVSDQATQPLARESGGQPSAWEAPLALHGGWRALLVVVGGALLVSTTIALFRSDNELGTSAIAVIGSLLVLVGILGQWPDRLTCVATASCPAHGVGQVRDAIRLANYDGGARR
jgi:hypothetical protein